MKILLVGYYGHGNFGDDVLFKTSFSFLREAFPSARIDVQSEADNPCYLEVLAREPLEIMRLGQHAHYDLVFHGGGGTFFDFSVGRRVDLVMNGIMQTLGYRRAASLLSKIRTIAGRSSLRGLKQIGVGLGVGAYTGSSRKLRHDLTTLHNFDFLSVRDAESARNSLRLGAREPAISTDLAFATRYWCPEGKLKAAPGANHIVMIVRGWRHEPGRTMQHRLVSAARELRSPVTFLSLDRQDDADWLGSLADISLQVYEPGNLAMVTNMLARSKCWISARAHGAICGAIAGRPGLILPIEAKLKHVARMLPCAAKVLDEDGSWDLECLTTEVAHVPGQAVDKDVKENQIRIEATLREMQKCFSC